MISDEDKQGETMNITTILGSPRKSGSTATVLGWVENELEANGHHIDRIDIMKCGIKNGCLGCYACNKAEYLKSSSAGNLVIPGCSPGNPPDENARKQTREFAQTLLSSIT